MMRERSHLSTLQVRVGRQDRVDMVYRPAEKHGLKSGQRHVLPLYDATQVQTHVGHDLVVAAARRVNPGAGVADYLGQPSLDCHVHVLVTIARHKLACIDLAADGGKAVLDLAELQLREHARAAQGAGMCHRPFDVLGPETPVEGQRAVQRYERSGALAGEASRACDRHRQPPILMDRPSSST